MSFSLKSPSSLLKFRNIVLVGAAINVYKLVNSSKLSQKFPPSLFARRSRTRASKLNFHSLLCVNIRFNIYPSCFMLVHYTLWPFYFLNKT